MATRRKCIICDIRPARIHVHCHVCHAEIRKIQAERADEPVKYLAYHGAVVGLYPNGNGKLRARPLAISAAHLPKARTINLDVWCDGFTKDMVRKFKACVLSLTGVHVAYVNENKQGVK